MPGPDRVLGASRFHTTRWSVVLAAGGSREALEEQLEARDAEATALVMQLTSLKGALQQQEEMLASLKGVA